MSERHIVPAAGGTGLRLKRGEQLRVIDPEGGQSGDLVAPEDRRQEALLLGGAAVGDDRRADHADRDHEGAG